MKQFSSVLVAAMAIIGCGENDTPLKPETKPQPMFAKTATEFEQDESQAAGFKTAGTNKGVRKPDLSGAFTNSLGMVFKPVPNTAVQFCIWETRVQDYAAYAAANGGVDDEWKNPGFTQVDTHPVVKVNWEDAQGFCAWLTQEDRAAGKITASQRYRLPSDAEWSAAVGLGVETGPTPKEKNEGIKDVYPWGTEWPPPKNAGNYDTRLNIDSFEHTSPVGSFAANKNGLHDLGGNVWEWCEDRYDTDAKIPRVLRGASWRKPRRDLMLSSRRVSDVPDIRDKIVGFRCVLANGSGQ